MTYGLKTFKKGLDRFMDENSIMSYMMRMCIILVLVEGIAQCQIQGRGKRKQIFCRVCSLRHPVGHCKIQEAGLED